jgi:hypothetical protein
MGGGVELALPGLRWGWAADGLVCALAVQCKDGGGSVALALLGSVCTAWFAQLGLLGLRWC